MTHLHKTSGAKFECGELIEIGTGKTFDMTVITHWPSDEEPPVIVGYYFGEYTPETTDYYVDEWLTQRAKDEAWLDTLFECREIVEAYLITNDEVLEDAQRDKVLRVLKAISKKMQAAFED